MNQGAPARSVNAWIYLNEDEPAGTWYKSQNSCFQTLIEYGVYKYTDMLSICWVGTVPTSSTTVPQGNGSSYTVQLGTHQHNTGTQPPYVSNQQYMDWVISDARAANPKIRIQVMLVFGATEITQIFSGSQSQWPKQAAAFADNLVTYLQHYNLDGFDIDWESPLSDNGTPTQFQILFTAVRTAFQQAYSKTGRYYYLTLSPAEVGTLDAGTINSSFDFVNLQLYSGFTIPSDFTNAGVNLNLLAYGAKFESIGNGITMPYQNAQNAWQGYQSGPDNNGKPPYVVATQWRLNSGEFMYEQAQQIILHQLIQGIAGPDFDDSPIIQLAGQSTSTPLISQLAVRSGEVLDSIQVSSVGGWNGITLPPYWLPQHGGNGGSPTTVNIPSGDTLATVSGYTGVGSAGRVSCKSS